MSGPGDDVWVVVTPPPGLRHFGGEHTLYVEEAAQVSSSGRARRCVVVVTCQMMFVCGDDGSVRRVVNSADLVDVTQSTRPSDMHQEAAGLLRRPCQMVLVRVAAEHDVLLCVPTDTPKQLSGVLSAVHDDAMGGKLPVLGPPRTQVLFDTADLRKPTYYKLPPPEAACGDPNRRCLCRRQPGVAYGTDGQQPEVGRTLSGGSLEAVRQAAMAVTLRSDDGLPDPDQVPTVSQYNHGSADPLEARFTPPRKASGLGAPRHTDPIQDSFSAGVERGHFEQWRPTEPLPTTVTVTTTSPRPGGEYGQHEGQYRGAAPRTGTPTVTPPIPA
eukprot:Hpha_TRINITY_DN30153_c0_g1::TRINITY_DN30153_c0_g1_i1::g.110556::m.110556